MKRAFAISLLAAGAWAAGSAFAQPAPEQPVAVKVNHLPHHVRDRIHAKAEQGITALARYLDRTRIVYQLRLMDVVVGYDRFVFAGDAESIDRQLENAIREGKTRPVR